MTENFYSGSLLTSSPKNMIVIQFFIFFSYQLLTTKFVKTDSYKSEDIPAIQNADLPAVESSLNFYNQGLMGIRKNGLNNINVQTLLRNIPGSPYFFPNQQSYANLLDLKRIQQRISDEQNIQNILRNTLRKSDESSLPFLRRIPFNLAPQNFVKFPAITARNTGIFDKIPNQEILQQLTLRQVLQQEKSILELLKRNSIRNQLVRSNSIDLKNIQEEQQRLINFLINQQRLNNNGRVNNVDESLFLNSELPEQSSFNSVEDKSHSEPLQIGKIFRVENRKNVLPISKQQYLIAPPRSEKFNSLQISPDKSFTFGENMINDVEPHPEASSENFELNKGDLMLFQQNGQQTADIYENEKIKAEEIPNSHGITIADDSIESSDLSNEDIGDINNTTVSI